ncbi:nitrite/sulfite reductase [Geomonas sp. RF6]|uniref:nitrite/sulfite reductase n=1 Tax=Geomonas sp. RF6 TaxID=2897342 RepID=UPI001E61D4F9|nr:nitrite/sulfite reductase [Geomonas sp. RF6]UFS72569.1 nitrite/sulfite reductase [Geomonas sp. RF6]
MATPPHLRLEGIYTQRQAGFFMQRIKLPAGLISSEQARKVADIADKHARGVVHLTVRESIELHWLTEEALVPVARALTSVGLVSRGACGGAVRGVVCGALGCAGAPRLEALSRRMHRHFTGNPRFERLPKKFKIGLEANESSGRHLIQDIGIVPAGDDTYNIYCAGGLGREPMPGFLLAEGVPEGGLIPLIEVVVDIYAERGAAGKRLKHLVAQLGREAFRDLVFSDAHARESFPSTASHFDTLLPLANGAEGRLEASVFAGELQADRLRALAAFADRWSGGILTVNSDQNIAFYLGADAPAAEAETALKDAGFAAATSAGEVPFRVCPGNHECILGLAPTRDVAAALVEAMGEEGRALTWALSGCPNSCAQPQLADVGIICARTEKEGEERVPRFDLHRKGEGAFAEAVEKGLTLTQLLDRANNVR